MTETDIKAPEKEKLRLQSKGKKQNDMETSAETETVSDTKNSQVKISDATDNDRETLAKTKTERDQRGGCKPRSRGWYLEVAWGKRGEGVVASTQASETPCRVLLQNNKNILDPDKRGWSCLNVM